MDDSTFILPDRAFLRITGADADSFLHGQLTVAVPGTPRRSRLTAWCDAKGRVIALFRVFPLGENDWLLSLPADLKEAVTKRLKMYILRSQVQIEDVSDRYTHIVCPAPDTGDNRVAPVLTLPAEGGWSEWLMDQSMQSAGDAGIRALVHAGIPEVFSVTSGKWVPQWLNLDQLDAIDFNKGCYPGQEVVAKLQFRGAVKRRMAFTTDPGDGQDIVLSTGSADETAEALVVQRG